jgi:hypothetical protein
MNKRRKNKMQQELSRCIYLLLAMYQNFWCLFRTMYWVVLILYSVSVAPVGILLTIDSQNLVNLNVFYAVSLIIVFISTEFAVVFSSVGLLSLIIESAVVASSVSSVLSLSVKSVVWAGNLLSVFCLSVNLCDLRI